MGAFALGKDEDRERLILDSRPPNLFERGLRTWSRTMFVAPDVVRVVFHADEVLALYSEDLRDHYYFFRVSPARAKRSTFVGLWKASDFRGFKAYRPELEEEEFVCAALSTMAMGDTSAVERGQGAHHGLAFQAGAVTPCELLYTHGAVPRSSYVAGLIIDDFGILERELALRCASGLLHPRPQPPLGSIAKKRIQAIRDKWVEVGLERHWEKGIERQLKGTMWGGALDGVEGEVRAPVEKTFALAILTLDVASLGIATVALLMILSGSWVAVLMYRRRMLPLLDLIFEVVKGRRHGDLIRLSPEFVSELLMLGALAPVCSTNLRAEVLDEVSLVDASGLGTAHVIASLQPNTADELYRHTVARGLWNRLLNRANQWYQFHGLLSPGDQLPQGRAHYGSPVWPQTAQRLTFSLVNARPHHRKSHINTGELNASLDAERRQGTIHPSTRPLVGGDSQVVTGCTAKGRSQSPGMNEPLVQALPDALGLDIYSGCVQR